MTVNQYLGRDCDESRAVSTETASMTYEISGRQISISTFDTTLELRFKLSQDKMYLSFDPSKEATVKEASELDKDLIYKKNLWLAPKRFLFMKYCLHRSDFVKPLYCCNDVLTSLTFIIF